MPKDTSISHTLISAHKDTPLLAAIDCIHLSKKQYDVDIQYIHIIFANIIKTGKKWQTIVSVVYEEDIDDDRSGAVVYGHLPRKYEDLYYDLLPNLNYLKLIEDDDVWKDMKTYLLNIYFYQAANFHQVDRITETGGGYFKQTKQEFELDLDTAALTLDFNEEQVSTVRATDQLFDASFYKATENKEIKVFKEQSKTVRDSLAVTGKISTMIPILRPSGPMRGG